MNWPGGFAGLFFGPSGRGTSLIQDNASQAAGFGRRSGPDGRRDGHPPACRQDPESLSDKDRHASHVAALDNQIAHYVDANDNGPGDGSEGLRMMALVMIAFVAILGVLATAGSFYALYSGPRKPGLAMSILLSATLVGASPFIALALGTSGQSWLRGLIILGLITFVAGVLAYLATLAFAKRPAALASAIPMTGLAAWSFLFLAIFSTGVA